MACDGVGDRFRLNVSMNSSDPANHARVKRRGKSSDRGTFTVDHPCWRCAWTLGLLAFAADQASGPIAEGARFSGFGQGVYSVGRSATGCCHRMSPIARIASPAAATAVAALAVIAVTMISACSSGGSPSPAAGNGAAAARPPAPAAAPAPAVISLVGGGTTYDCGTQPTITISM